MTTLTLACGTNDLIIDASASSATINSGAGITLSAATIFSVSGAIKFSSLVSGLASFDALGNMTAIAGSPFNPAAAQTPSGTWTFSNTVTMSSTTQVNSTLGVSGILTASGAFKNPGITTQASVLAVPTSGPPSGFSYAIVNNTTGQFYRMT